MSDDPRILCQRAREGDLPAASELITRFYSRIFAYFRAPSAGTTRTEKTLRKRPFQKYGSRWRLTRNVRPSPPGCMGSRITSTSIGAGKGRTPPFRRMNGGPAALPHHRPRMRVRLTGRSPANSSAGSTNSMKIENRSCTSTIIRNFPSAKRRRHWTSPPAPSNTVCAERWIFSAPKLRNLHLSKGGFHERPVN